MTGLLPHLAAAALYLAISVATALVLPRWMPGLSPALATALGAFVFLVGAGLHDATVRAGRLAAHRRALDRVTADRDRLAADLTAAREEAKAAREQLEQLPNAKAKLAAVGRQVALLQDLVAKVTPPAEPQEPLAGVERGAAYTPRMRPPELTYDRRGQPLDFADVSALGKEGLLAMVQQAVRYDRIDIALSPIVTLPARKTVAYEALSRIRTPGGKVLLWPDYQAAAEAAGLTTVIDNLLLFRCIQLVREAIRRSRDIDYFATISLKSLQDQDFMAQFLDFIRDAPDLAQHLVFEFAFDDLRAALGVAHDPMAELAGLGFGFAVDGVHDLARLDVEALEKRRIGTVKVPTDTFLAELRDPDHPLDINAFKHELTTVAIDLIADDVTREDQLLALLDLPIELGQGALFGPPR